MKFHFKFKYAFELGIDTAWLNLVWNAYDYDLKYS